MTCWSVSCIIQQFHSFLLPSFAKFGKVLLWKITNPLHKFEKKKHCLGHFNNNYIIFLNVKNFNFFSPLKKNLWRKIFNLRKEYFICWNENLIDYSTNVCPTCQGTWINETRLNSQQKLIPPKVGTGITNFL